MKKRLKNIQTFEQHSSELIEIKCKWCDKEFKPTKIGQFCCCPEHDSKYNDYLANDNSETPLDKYTKDNYKDTYYD